MKQAWDVMRMYLLFVVLLTLQACGAANALARAETVEQKAYAAYGEFVIVSEQAEKLILSGQLSDSTIIAIGKAEEAAKLAADPLIELTLEFGEIRAEFEEFGTGEARFIGTMNNLNAWTERLLPLVLALQNAKGET